VITDSGDRDHAVGAERRVRLDGHLPGGLGRPDDTPFAVERALGWPVDPVGGA